MHAIIPEQIRMIYAIFWMRGGGSQDVNCRNSQCKITPTRYPVTAVSPAIRPCNASSRGSREGVNETAPKMIAIVRPQKSYRYQRVFVWAKSFESSVSHY